MSVVCGQLDVSQISDEEIIAISGAGAWVACDVEEKIYEIIGQPYAYAVIKFNSPCWTTTCPEDNSSLVAKSFLMLGNSLETTIKSSSGNPSVSGSEDLPGSGLDSGSVCGVDISLLRMAQEVVDALQVNEKGFQPAAVRPNASIIPMKSNVYSYGPWASSNFATTYGGADIQVNNDLAPWLFGSYGAMNEAGQELANTSIVGLNRAEKGSVSVLGMPTYNIGTILNTTGPTLTNINVNFGSNGVTSSYDFATYTPKFGQLSRAIIEKYKKMSQIRNEQLRFLRQNQIANNKIMRKIASISNLNNGETSKSISDKNSLSRILIGESFDSYSTINSGVGQRTIVGVSTLSKSVLEMRGSGYKYKAFMSLDGLLSPVSISGGQESCNSCDTTRSLPRFIQLPGVGINAPSGMGWTISPNPPIIKSEADAESIISNSGTHINSKLNTISIHKSYINPLSNPGDIPYQDGGSSAGHNIDIVGRETGIPTSGLITNFYRPNDGDKYSNDYRFLALRGPIVLHSWGYDTDGKPVPNEIDTEEDIKDSGVFAYNNLTNNFLEDWLQKPKTWPVAPVDLRLDRERGVWVAPKEHKIVTVKLLEDLAAFGMAKGLIVNSKNSNKYGKQIVDENGNNINNENSYIVIEDRVGESTPINTLAYAYFDSYTSKYLLLNAGIGGITFGSTAGLWPKNTFKMVRLWKVSGGVSTPSGISDFYGSDDYVNVLNVSHNLGGIADPDDPGSADEYKVVIAPSNGIYLYIGGSC